MDQEIEELAGLIASDGEVALILPEAPERRPLSLQVSEGRMVTFGGKTFSVQEPVARQMETQKLVLFVVMDGDNIGAEYDVAVRAGA